jgi:hypothetical protein
MHRILIKKCFIYGGKCLMHKAVHNWIEIFSQGHMKVTDDARPGRPVEIVTEKTVQRLEELSRVGRRITIDSAARAIPSFCIQHKA